MTGEATPLSRVRAQARFLNSSGGAIEWYKIELTKHKRGYYASMEQGAGSGDF
jgi:hypothetical protein